MFLAGLSGSSEYIFVVVQLLSHVQFFSTPCTVARQAPLSFTISWSWLRLMSTELMMPSKHLILCCPFPACLQSFPASGSFLMSQFFASGGQSVGGYMLLLLLLSRFSRVRLCVTP